MTVTLKEMSKETYSFETFHISMASTLCREFNLKNDLSVEIVPSFQMVNY